MSKLEKIIQELELYGFCHLTDVLNAAELHKIKPLFDLPFVPAKVGKASGPQRAEEIRGDLTHWLDPANPPEELKEVLAFIDSIKTELNRQFYLGLKDYECHLAKYPVGSFYKKHLDRFEQDSSRSVSFIFYLHESWSNRDGGELILYNKSNEVLEMIEPKPGSMVLFLSERFPHEVKPSQKERKSLTGWMHTKLLT